MKPSFVLLAAALLGQASAESQTITKTEFFTEPTLTLTYEPILTGSSTYGGSGGFGGGFGGGFDSLDRCPGANSWAGPSDYCIAGRLHYCQYPDAPANGLSNDCGGRGCHANPPGIPDRCNRGGRNPNGNVIDTILGGGNIIDAIINDWKTDAINNIIGGGRGSNGGRVGGGRGSNARRVGAIQSSTDTYRVDAFEDLCIDITDGRIMTGQATQLWHCDNRNKNQRFIPFSDGTLRVAADTSLCLDAHSGLSVGAPIQLWECTGNENQTWDLRLNRDGTIRSRSRPDLCFNIEGGFLQAGERLQLWSCTAASNEKFLNIGSM